MELNTTLVLLYMKGILKLIFTFSMIPFLIIEAAFVSLTKKEKNIEGNVVVVTGGGNGFGKELCLQLSQLGCTVLCVDIKNDDLMETVATIEKQRKTKDCVRGYLCDITDRKAVYDLRDRIIEDFGHVDILFNNAGITYLTDLQSSDPENIVKAFDINVLGQIWMTKAFLEKMKERQRGQIVFTSSWAAVMQLGIMPIYNATKAALTAFALSIREDIDNHPEWKNIIISIAHPQMVNTNDLVKKSYISLYPALNVTSASRILITGARRNYLEYSVPGYDVVLTLLKFWRCLPTRFTRMIIPGVISYQFTRLNDEVLMRDLMSHASSKVVFEKHNIADSK